VIRRAVVVVALVWWAALPAAAQTKNWPSERPPRPLRAHDVKFPPYAFRTLPNGLQVVAVSHHEQPAVSLRLIVRAGTAQDPENRPGVASLLATLLDQGTTTKSAEQIAQGIDSIGGALGTGAVSDLTFINAVVMKDSLGVGLDFVSDIAQHPGFAPEEIDRQRQQILSSLKVSYDDPDYLADMVFDRSRARPRRSRQSGATISWPSTGSGSGPITRFSRSSATSAQTRHLRARSARSATGDARRPMRPASSIRRRRRAASSSSIGPARSRRRSASATSASRASTTTTWPWISP
jgi:hypothetical protein